MDEREPDRRGCEKVVNQVSAVLDGEVSAVARLKFRTHLALCPPCKRYVRQLQAVKEAAGQVTAADLPEDFAAVLGSVLAVIEGEGARE